MLRTHTCGELRAKHVGKKATLAGWVDTIRSHGRLWFIDIRDRYGKTQVVFLENKDNKKLLKSLSTEACIGVTGPVQERKKGTENKDLPTGDVELFCETLDVFNTCPPLPFALNDESVSEDVRLQHRFLDLRSERMQKNIVLRHKVLKAIHDYLDKEGFIHVETPILNKSTPEGARDYLVPSRVHPGHFYALPQSPQIMKQLMMAAGYDKYYQIAKCFRDEDLRADRQPEFTQLDMEMSFVDVEDVISIMEKLWAYVFKEVLGITVKTPFPRLTYEEAMEQYDRDDPDTRKKGEQYAFVWVTDFPMFEKDEESGRVKAMHHPFTSPADDQDFAKPLTMKSKGYDLVLNGSEIGGGSIRIHDQNIQEQIFEILGLSKEEATEKFGFLLNALSYGAPPMGGVAFGIDRVVQLMAGVDNIREVTAFPKNKAAQDVMMDSPSKVNEKQLRELSIKLDIAKKKGK